MKRENLRWFVALSGILVLLYGSFLFHKINLITADLGRHIKNGEEILKDFDGVFSTNFYSYTTPDFPVINHHWASGLLFYGIWHVSGFDGLQIFFALVSISTFLIMLWLAYERAGPGIAALIGLCVIPLLAERTEIRPEALSYFFAAVFFFLLTRATAQKISWRSLYIALPLLQIFWANTHIFFFLGPVIIGVFLFNTIWEYGFFSHMAKRMATLFCLAGMATLVNPAGIKGAIAPFLIFQNYGYAIAENKTVWFVQQFMSNPNFIIVKIIFVIALASLVLRVAMRKFQSADDHDNTLVADFLLLLGFGTMALLQIRNFTLFGFFALPLISGNIAYAFRAQIPHMRRQLALTALVATTIALFLLIPGKVQQSFPYWREFGIGLETENMQAINFLRDAAIKGPIFNNYDIGGYLIFGLFPHERVFVDNRPEAYPASFFRDIYIPMQESQERWQAADRQYGFNAIVFSLTDMTPWAQTFLIARIQDSEWVPVFADGRVIIFVKNTETNQTITTRYAIPKDHFRIMRL